ncbi:MAG TPA: 2-C-methyl-D-erythritol 4-phosphate cytidylyltransferase [Deinococcales bacterium]|nr:2-C-methyl-D-erythritol 4-phosphate cytidylyltransferase [Deinococcales bacterium]
MNAAGLLPAAGQGLRLGLGPKALVELDGRNLLSWAAAGLAPAVTEIIAAVPAGSAGRFRELHPDLHIIEGGETRQETVRLLLEATSADHVLIHDAARPFLSADVARRVLEAARQHGAASAAVPLADTLVNADSGANVPREGVYRVQTPQGFRHDLISEAHARARTDGTAATDDAGLVRNLGQTVQTVPGSAWLFKITGPDDLALARAAAAGRR